MCYDRGMYILEGHTPVQCHDVLTWAKWFQTANKHVAKTEVAPGVRVSTVFLGLDHRWGSEGPPVLFETMVFGGQLNGEIERYCTWEDAEAGHKAMIENCCGASSGRSRMVGVRPRHI